MSALKLQFRRVGSIKDFGSRTTCVLLLDMEQRSEREQDHLSNEQILKQNTDALLGDAYSETIAAEGTVGVFLRLRAKVTLVPFDSEPAAMTCWKEAAGFKEQGGEPYARNCE